MLKLTDEQLDWILERIPDAPKSPKGGRPTAAKRDVLRGIFWMLDNGAKWKDLPRRFGSKSTVHRWFAKWVRDGVFEKLLQSAGRCVERRGEYRLYECFIDARGLPVAVDTTSAGPHESRLVQPLFDFMLTRATPQRVIGDKAYDSDKLDEELAERGVELIAPHRTSRKDENVTQDRRPLQRYRRRWTVERSIAWIQNFRRLCIRWEKSTKLFRGFLHLGCTLLLLRPVLG